MILSICSSAPTKLDTLTTKSLIRYWEIPTKCSFCKISKLWLLIYFAEPSKLLKEEELWSSSWEQWPVSNNSILLQWMFIKDTELTLLLMFNLALTKDFCFLSAKTKIVSLWTMSSTFYPFQTISTISNLSKKGLLSIVRPTNSFHL